MRNPWGNCSPQKYGNVKVTYAGHVFDSIGERDRYLVLLDKQKRGEITDLMLKPAFPIEVNGVKIFERPYHPDFSYRLDQCPAERRCQYIDSADRCPYCFVIEDHKGYRSPSDPATRIFEIQRKLMRAIYGIEVQVVQTPDAERRQERRKANQATQRHLARLAKKQASR